MDPIQTPPHMANIPYFTFNLDLDPKLRWAEILNHFQSRTHILKSYATQIINQYSKVLPIAKLAFNPDEIMYREELEYIASCVDMELFHIVLLQLLYETSAACTTGIFDCAGTKLLIRTMDWPMEFLKDFTIGLNIYSGNTQIASAVTWVGCVGLFTATNLIHKHTVCVNYRRTVEMSIGKFLKNAYRTKKMNFPISYLVREVITNTTGINDTIRSLELTKLISPVYFTVFDFANLDESKSCIITRDCDKLVDTRYDNLVQTNCDNDKTEPNILYSIDRRRLVRDIQYFRYHDKEKIIREFMQFPIMNEETIYVHVVCSDSTIATFV